jgi:alkanesulfonate monooxygenase SsuD/methylene tetrahydromethanopterin reductase-like flavin-dependent oxidoreductase (luciferase family)
MVAFARRAEELGLDSLWVLERILRPVAPAREPLLPAHSASVYSPLETLAFIAGKTDVIRLGTSVLDALFHVPAALGRQLATVDRLSNGRLLVGLGQGWSTEEFQTAGVPMSRRGSDSRTSSRRCRPPGGRTRFSTKAGFIRSRRPRWARSRCRQEGRRS